MKTPILKDHMRHAYQPEAGIIPYQTQTTEHHVLSSHAGFLPANFHLKRSTTCRYYENLKCFH